MTLAVVWNLKNRTNILPDTYIWNCIVLETELNKDEYNRTVASEKCTPVLLIQGPNLAVNLHRTPDFGQEFLLASCNCILECAPVLYSYSENTKTPL